MTFLLITAAVLVLLTVGCLLEHTPWLVAAVERDEARLDGELP